MNHKIIFPITSHEYLEFNIPNVKSGDDICITDFPLTYINTKDPSKSINIGYVILTDFLRNLLKIFIYNCPLHNQLTLDPRLPLNFSMIHNLLNITEAKLIAHHELIFNAPFQSMENYYTGWLYNQDNHIYLKIASHFRGTTKTQFKKYLGTYQETIIQIPKKSFKEWIKIAQDLIKQYNLSIAI